MFNHNKAQQSKNRVHISWDILYIWLCKNCRFGASYIKGLRVLNESDIYKCVILMLIIYAIRNLQQSMQCFNGNDLIGIVYHRYS